MGGDQESGSRACDRRACCDGWGGFVPQGVLHLPDVFCSSRNFLCYLFRAPILQPRVLQRSTPPSLQTRPRPGQRLPWAQALLPSAPFLLSPSQASLPTLKSPNLPHKRPKPPKLPKALLLLPSVLKCLPMLSPKTPPLLMTLLPPTLDPDS